MGFDSLLTIPVWHRFDSVRFIVAGSQSGVRFINTVPQNFGSAFPVLPIP